MLKSSFRLLALAGISAALLTGCQSAPENAGATTGGTTGSSMASSTSAAAPPTTAPAAVSTPTIAAAPDADFDKAKALPGYADIKKMKDPKIGDTAATSKGAELFAANCASCHGPAGMGDGPAGLSLNPRPRNQTNTKEYKYGYGELGIFRTVKHGIPGTGMAAFPQLSDDDIWCVANFVRTLQKT